MQQQKINFRQERDFGSVLGDSIKFLKQNFKSFFSSVILIVGPFILVISILYSFVQTSMMSNIQRNPANPLAMFNNDYFMSVGIMVFSGFVSNILLSSVSYNYMCLYNEKPFGEKISVSEVARRLWDNIGRLLISAITFLIVMVVFIVLIVLICIGMFSGLGIGGGILIGLIIFFGMIIFTPVLMYFVPASFYLVVRDNVFIFTAMGKVRKYLSGNFWWTWLIMVVTLICLGILQGLFNLPATIMGMAKLFSRGQEAGSDNSVLLMVFYTLGMFLTYCTSSVSHIITAFNFMSHEEKHEGKGLQSKIDEIM
jgi:hypothetical protein